MKFVKGMILGITLGAMAGIAVLAINCDDIYRAMKAGKKEIKRFRKKYC